MSRVEATDSWHRLIVEAAPQALMLIDRRGQVVVINRATDQLFGYPRDELVGRSIDQVVPGPPGGGPPLRALVEDPPRTAASYQMVGRCHDGSEVPIEVQLTAIDAPDGALALASITVTDARLSADQLRQEMAALFDAADDAIVSTTLDGTIRAFNPAAEQMFGYRADEIIDQPVTVLLPTERVDEERQIIAQLSSGQRVVHMTTVRQCKDGSQIDVALTVTPLRNRVGDLVGASKFIRNTTEQKRVQEMFRLVVESAPNALVVANQQRLITLVNRRTEEMFGYARDELIGQRVDLLVPAAYRAAHTGHMDGYFAAPTTRVMGVGRDVVGRRKDGSEIPLEIGLSSLRTSQGLFTLASVIDITDRKETENELRRSNAELEQFAYIASHDLQEPLRMVASYTELLGQRYRGKLDEKADKYIHYAVDGAKRMQLLVTDLLAYSRVGSQGKPLVPVDTQAVVGSVVDMLRAPIRKASAKVEIGRLPSVLADEGQLRQLFQNLIGNAIKFRAEADPVIGVRAARHGERWLFCVEDNGIGIDMQYAERVFQMFQRLHERGKYDGSGIGLSIAKRIVERHGGTIWLESKPGLGTSFFFSLAPATTKGSL